MLELKYPLRTNNGCCRALQKSLESLISVTV